VTMDGFVGLTVNFAVMDAVSTAAPLPVVTVTLVGPGEASASIWTVTVKSVSEFTTGLVALTFKLPNVTVTGVAFMK
jgi:hypothetical protein